MRKYCLLLLYIELSNQANMEKILDPIVITPKDPKTTWVAIDVLTSEIIAEGKSPTECASIADPMGKDYILSFIPDPDTTYIL